MNDDIMLKLKKVLRMAEDAKQGDRKEEFEASMEAALRLSHRHQIDLATVNLDDESIPVNSEPIVNLVVKTAKGNCRRPPSNKWVVGVLCEFFGVEIVYGGSRYSSSTIWIIGRESTAKMAEWMYFHLVSQFNRCWREYRDRTGAASFDRETYFAGLNAGLWEKLTKARKDETDSIVHELPSTQQTRCELALVNEKEVVRQAMERFHPVLVPGKPARMNVNYNSDHFSKGYRDGKEVTLAAPLT